MTTLDGRPTWFLCPNGMPVRSDTRRIPAGATHSAREGDATWTPLSGATTPREGRAAIPADAPSLVPERRTTGTPGAFNETSDNQEGS